MRMLTPYWSTGLTSEFFDEVDRLFGDFDRGAAYDERTLNPACEVSESDDHFLMSVDIPGMKKNDIKIEMNENVLVISGERKRESSAGQKHKIQRYEKSYGYFKRSFTLPASVDANKIEARYEDGVLELYLPKSQVSSARRIEIQSGKEAFFNKLLPT
jgi:HSP20 family protein